MRWNIESHFDTIKYNLSFKDFHSKSEDQIKQEIYTHEFITVLTRLLEDSYIKYNRLTEQMQIKKTNFKININNVCDKVIYLLLYSPDFIHKTIFIFKTLFQYIYTVIHDRHYLRRRITPVSKWYQINKDVTV